MKRDIVFSVCLQELIVHAEIGEIVPRGGEWRVDFGSGHHETPSLLLKAIAS